MSRKNWKKLQQIDAKNLNLISNADRPAAPNAPDGITIVHALKHLQANFIPKDIFKILNFHTGIYPESKSGYANAPKKIYQYIEEQKRNKNILYRIYAKDIIFMHKNSFFTLLFNEFILKEEQIIHKNIKIEYKIPKYLYDWLEQADGYIDEENGYKYPVVLWQPKNVRFYKDGLAIIRQSVFIKIISSFSPSF